jgi:hypothetical protein
VVSPRRASGHKRFQPVPGTRGVGGRWLRQAGTHLEGTGTACNGAGGAIVRVGPVVPREIWDEPLAAVGGRESGSGGWARSSTETGG